MYQLYKTETKFRQILDVLCTSKKSLGGDDVLQMSIDPFKPTSSSIIIGFSFVWTLHGVCGLTQFRKDGVVECCSVIGRRLPGQVKVRRYPESVYSLEPYAHTFFLLNARLGYMGHIPTVSHLG